MSFENQNIHENARSPREIYENHENIKIPLENKENHENPRIPYRK